MSVPFFFVARRRRSRALKQHGGTLADAHAHGGEPPAAAGPLKPVKNPDTIERSIGKMRRIVDERPASPKRR